MVRALACVLLLLVVLRFYRRQNKEFVNVLVRVVIEGQINNSFRFSLFVYLI